MEKVVIGLYDKTVYSERFAEYFCNNKNNCIDFRIFTVFDKISEFVKKGRLDVLLLGQEYVDEIKNTKEIGKIIVLSEGNYVMEGEKYPVVFKYQSVENIINEVLENIADDEKIRLEENNKNPVKINTELIGVYSSDSVNLALKYGVDLAIKTAKVKKTLLVCLDQLNGLDGALRLENNMCEQFFSYEGENMTYETSYVRGMSEVIYYLNKKGSKLALKLQSIICHRGGVDCIYSVEDYRDLKYFDIEGVEEFISILSGQMEYETIIFVIGYLNETFIELMQRCDKLYFSAVQDEIDRQRFSSFEKTLMRDGLAGSLDNIMFYASEKSVIDGGECSDEELYELIEERVFEKSHSTYISQNNKEILVRGIFNSIRGMDVLQELVDNPDITEIMVNGCDNIFIEKNGRISRYPEKFVDVNKLEDVIQQIVSKVNRVVNETSPIVDFRLVDGSRVNVVLPPVSLSGPVVTIRKFPESPMTMEKLIEIGSLTKDAASFLEKLVKAGYNIFISGGTGSGKTTFLNALSDYIPKDERIITIEDAAELQIRNIQNLVRLEVRNANVEGKNAVTIRDLLKSSLRMRPDRIILGEIRDAAACELLNIMNTGHDGSLCTGHANSSKDMLSRMETLVLSGMDIPVMAIRNQIASALDIIIHLGRIRDKTRKVLEIAEIVGMEGDRIKLQTLFEFVEEGEDKDGRVKGSLCRREKGLIHTEKLQRAGIEL